MKETQKKKKHIHKVPSYLASWLAVGGCQIF